MGSLSVAEKQLVEVAKALSVNARIIAMDEPTSSLTRNETEKLFDIIRGLKKSGITVIYISHKLDEVFAVCDTVTVLRDGHIVDTKPVGDTSHSEVISSMVGGPVEMSYPARSSVVQPDVVLEAREVACAGFVKASPSRCTKERFSGSPAVGSGRTELVEAIFGARPLQAGEIFVHGRKVRIRNTADGKRAPWA